MLVFSQRGLFVATAAVVVPLRSAQKLRSIIGLDTYSKQSGYMDLIWICISQMPCQVVA